MPIELGPFGWADRLRIQVVGCIPKQLDQEVGQRLSR